MSQIGFFHCYYKQDVLGKGVIHLNAEQRELIEQLYILYEQPMYRIAYAILHNVEQAEDAVHDAFVAVIKSEADFDRADSEETKHYMIRTIRNTAINRYRKKRL